MTMEETVRPALTEGAQTPPSILQVSTYDTIGGAERVAWNLFRAYRARGIESWLAVGHKLGGDPHVLEVPNRDARGGWARLGQRVGSSLDGGFPGTATVARIAAALGEPGSALDAFRGREDFRFPGTWRLLSLTPRRPNVLHCHNLHGRYFDVRALPWLSAQVPVVLTLHDAWLLSGHCAHSLECERWRIGCGHCPDLALDPPVRRDATAFNWKRKREIFERSRLYIATPSAWLMHKVRDSMLAGSLIESRVIPNGIDLDVFHPSERSSARTALGIPVEARVILFAATDLRRNPWKDYETIREAVARTSARLTGQSLILLAIGEADAAPHEHVGSAELRFLPQQSDTRAVARWYQAADVYAHAARADTFPNTVLEALACGTPVVATAVGGIPEQIEDGRTGFLVPAEDPEALAERLTQLLSNDALRQRVAACSVEAARGRFDLRRQVDAYLDWYSEMAPMAVPGDA
jgi:glycosyltransferase involved in cell wall biosynthesis